MHRDLHITVASAATDRLIDELTQIVGVVTLPVAAENQSNRQESDQRSVPNDRTQSRRIESTYADSSSSGSS